LLPVSAGVLPPLFAEELIQFSCLLQFLILLSQFKLLLGGLGKEDKTGKRG